MENSKSSNLYSSFELLPTGSMLPELPLLPWRKNEKINFKGFFMCTTGIIVSSDSAQDNSWLYEYKQTQNTDGVFVFYASDTDKIEISLSGNEVTSYLVGDKLKNFKQSFSSIQFTNKQPCLWFLAQGRIKLKIVINNNYSEIIEKLKNYNCISDVPFWKYYSICYQALMNSHVPYQPTAACGVVVVSKNKYYSGSTVQNCAYPSSICAFQAAVAIAISNGVKHVDGILISGTSRDTPRICGSCLEFSSCFGDVPLFFFTQREISSKINEEAVLPNHMYLLSELFLQKEKNIKNPINSERKTIENWKILPISSSQIATFNDSKKNVIELLNAAIRTSQNAAAILSKFPVGAAVETDKGIFVGANVEHEYLRFGLCAERVALCNAIANGATEIRKVAVYCHNLTKDDKFGTLCGACRQAFAEFGNTQLYIIKHRIADEYDILEKNLFDILLYPFSPSMLIK